MSMKFDPITWNGGWPTNHATEASQDGVGLNRTSSSRIVGSCGRKCELGQVTLRKSTLTQLLVAHASEVAIQ